MDLSVQSWEFNQKVNSHEFNESDRKLERPLVSALLWKEEGAFKSAWSACAASAHHVGVGADNCWTRAA